jgi:putative iron-regulated protein
LFLINLNKKYNHMKRLTLGLSFAAAAGLVMASCSDDDNKSNTGVTKEAVVENYADIVYQNYKDAYDDAVELETAINVFTDSPTDGNFTIAKNKWKDARESYGTTEAFRFANGPIDAEDGPEGLINAWPLDENYIDYVVNDADEVVNGGIINSTATYPSITKDLLISLNEDGGEKNISTGYHAIEFLLWGQDLTDPSEKKAGLRAYTDFVNGGTNLNQDRRRDYLSACADLLTDHLDYLVNQWKVGGDYRTEFLALPVDTALQNIYLGIATLSSAELAVERIAVALANMDQEDEHSCFSDNTHRDIYLNYKGIVNVYNGEYGDIDGPSLADLVKQADGVVAIATDVSIATTNSSIAAIATPFDFAIQGGAESAEGAKVKTASDNLIILGANLLAGASKLGISVTIE